jgi:ABC-type transporter Mla subunit MlaD
MSERSSSEAANKSKKNEFTKAVIALMETHGPGLAKAKTDKALMAQITADYAADWEKIRQNFENAAVASAQAGRKNCTLVAAQAGSSLFQSEKDQQQNALGAAATPFAQLASQLGGAVAQTFPPSSAAARAMDMLTIGYRGSLNMVPGHHPVLGNDFEHGQSASVHR